MIFCVEDDNNIRELVVYTLETTGFKARGFEDGSRFLEALALDTPELILLDIMLPGEDGISLLKQLKASVKTRDIPVIMMTAKGTEYDKVKGLDLGADDYVTKPFRPLELMARIKAQLRRYAMMSPKKNSSILTIGALTIDKENHRCFLDNQLLSLTPTEFSILWLLCSNKGKVVSVDQIFHDLWGEKYYTNSSSSIMVHIRHLREKMNDSAENPRYIQTVWGVGYKIE